MLINFTRITIYSQQKTCVVIVGRNNEGQDQYHELSDKHVIMQRNHNVAAQKRDIDYREMLLLSTYQTREQLMISFTDSFLTKKSAFTSLLVNKYSSSWQW